jgi:hypothetical protein
MDIYRRHGFKNQKDYLQYLSAEYNIPVETVYCVAGTLGNSEDFDGLITALEDIQTMFNESVV